MNQLNPEKLHHAYIIEGNKVIVINKLIDFIENKLGMKFDNNPDIICIKTNTFSIDDSRRIKDWHNEKPIVDKKIAILQFDSITREAQNALLKAFEEPSGDTHFFAIMPSSRNILPTILSRSIKLSFQNVFNTHQKISEAFFNQDYQKKSKIITDINEKIKNGDWTRKDVSLFYDEVLCLARKEKCVNLNKLLEVKKFLDDNSSSVKMILELAAIILIPQK